MNKLIAQFLRFSAVGITAFAIDYGLMILLTELFAVPYLCSVTISFVASTVFNYFASMHFVFVRKDDISRKREFIIFVTLSTLGLVWNDVLMWLTVEHLYIDYRIAKILVAVVVSVWNFVTRKMFLEAHD